MSATAPPVDTARVGHPQLRYLMAAAAGTPWAVNGTVAKVIREHGLSALQLAEVRSAGAFLGFGVAVAAFAPGRLRIERRELALGGAAIVLAAIVLAQTARS